jgi:hypothetical protein
MIDEELADLIKASNAIYYILQEHGRRIRLARRLLRWWNLEAA